MGWGRLFSMGVLDFRAPLSHGSVVRGLCVPALNLHCCLPAALAQFLMVSSSGHPVSLLCHHVSAAFRTIAKKYIYVCWKMLEIQVFVVCVLFCFVFFLPLSSIIQFKNHFLMFISSLTFTVVTVFISRDVLVCLVSHSSFWLRNASG